MFWNIAEHTSENRAKLDLSNDQELVETKKLAKASQNFIAESNLAEFLYEFQKFEHSMDSIQLKKWLVL